MFAVPGWDVSPDSLVAQTAHPDNSKARQELSNRKRKRKDKAAKELSQDVTADNVDELLNKLVHGAHTDEQDKREKSSKDKKARQKHNDHNDEEEKKHRIKKEKRKEKRLRRQAEETNDNTNEVAPDSATIRGPKPQSDSPDNSRPSDDDQASSKKSDKPAKKKHKNSKTKPEHQSTENDELPQEDEDSLPTKNQDASTNTAPEGEVDKASKNEHPSLEDETKQSYPFLTRPARPRKTKGPKTSAPKYIPPTLTPLQAQMAEKLQSSRFRHLNETLYTSHSSSAQTLFADSPSSFDDYHTGFARQVSTWPVNPLNTILERVLARGSIQKPLERRSAPKNKNKPPKPPLMGPLPRSMKGLARIADLGCGTAQLASKLHSTGAATRLKLNVQSFDLVAANVFVTQADIRELPVEDEQVDVVVLCLALMGTNWVEFVEEAWRICRWKGEVWIVEVVSRFARMGDRDGGSGTKENADKLSYRDKSKAKEKERADDNAFLAQAIDGSAPAVDPEETDLDPFLQLCRSRGLILDGVPEKNKMFVSMRFLKTATPTKGRFIPEQVKARLGANHGWRGEEKEEVGVEDEGKVLKPCLYKAR
ncbi:MAG: 25S rRNA (adenine645-N1)-methyltransferase [Vezdaea aestivalis]|nr:MAG: 25S rRNA (adenine645-N1)-methyltransferase [Vezdaea aestivalis]